MFLTVLKGNLYYFQKLTIPKEEIVYFKVFHLKHSMWKDQIFISMISSMDINIKQSICRHYMAPRIYLSYEKQLTTTDRFLLVFFFFWKICKFLNLCAKLQCKSDCIVQSLNKYSCNMEPKKVRKNDKKATA